MKKILGFFFLLLSSTSIICQNSYFDKFRSLADSLSEVHSIPSCVILAVGFHESGAGTSTFAKLLNNHFGIKGTNDLYKTHKIKTSYKYYPTAEESFRGFCRLVTAKKYYETLKGNNDYKKWVKAIARAGYARSADRWSGHVIKIIKLYQLDKKAEEPVQNSAP